MPIPRRPSGQDVRLISPAAALPDGLDVAALAFDAAPVALVVTTLDGQCLRVNQAMCDLVGHPADRLLGATYHTLTHPEDLHLDHEAVAVLMAGATRGPSIEKRLRHADGQLIWVRVTATLLRDAGGAPIGAVVAAEDIAEHRSRHAELSRLAMHDPLTGIRNRALLDHDIDRVLRARDRDGGVVAVFYLDVDDFKQINDVHGHDAGDLALVVLSTRMRDALREEDTVARVGGDEFVLAAHLPTAADARELCNRVEWLCSEPVALRGRTLSVRVSAGLALIDATGCTAAQALASADAAMYAAKRNRKDAAAP
ncbi:GGDEF domain-containing protein [Geodermatophilus ruber]|uniref:PAS domain S-box-containing protein/diguanylate cyclase (GGDEF) domain-containing protein n=1 Tax=Geodermatophilus ruber TaxID=504800 RepID=A0A1I4IUR2_9ACTN|nr:GGDEF domain-containing protein [Geodermatophilus ruber]SFL58088.1 PAS domain S-box-containing protein/diguanylate cyclase (GGDEF) domain-containing protein [Geodermatophilus ruber]